MSRTSHRIADVFATVCKPLTDAISAETGRPFDLSTVSVRKPLATAFRVFARVATAVADYLAPVPVAEPVAPAPVPVVEPAPVVVPAPVPVEPLPLVAEVEPAPATSAPAVVEPAPVPGGVEPAKVWTVTRIAMVHHIPAKTLRNHLANGRLVGAKSAEGWTVTDSDLTAYLATRTPTNSATK